MLAGSRALATLEFAQHIALDRDGELTALYRQRQLFQIELRLYRIFDLTDGATLDELGIAGAPACFTDRSVARATAGFLRHTRAADGLLVPSLSAPDNREHWNLLVFFDRLTEPLDAAALRITELDTFQIDPQSYRSQSR